MPVMRRQKHPPRNNIEHTEKEPTRASSLPADYIAGDVDNMDPKMCVSHGGSIRQIVTASSSAVWARKKLFI